MAFLKYAKANVVRPRVSKAEWATIRSEGRLYGRVTPAPGAQLRVASEGGAVNLLTQASEIFGSQFDPEKYLLTHATIVASVDVYTPPGVKLGRMLEGGFRVNRKYGDFRVDPKCDKFINNNLDCWSRPVLLKSFQTFIGGHNFVEHVQREELSKGRIIDAVARDIGDSVYIDILIATDRKHTDLVAAIESGKMATMSMGCTVDGTICTKCGHWAADETEMCPHVKYEKGNTFFDENGKQHRVAELCGHESLEPTGGVHFIEASWVETPAFTGAVLRNVLEPSAEIARRAEAILNTPPKQWDAAAQLKAARRTKEAVLVDELENRQRQAEESEVVGTVPASPLTGRDVLSFGAPSIEDSHFLVGWDDGMGGEPEAEAPAPPPAPKKDSPLKDVEDEVAKHLLDKVKKRLKDQLRDEDMDEATSMDPNDTVQHEATIKKAFRRLHATALETLIRTANSDAELLNGVAELNNSVGLPISIPIYRAALSAGPTNKYSSVDVFLGVCSSALQRRPTLTEAKQLIRLGHLLARRGQAHRE